MLLISRLSCKVSFPRLHSTLLPQASGRRTWTAAGWTTSRGFHPPAGSLSAALLACGWDGAGVSLSLAGFMAKQPATGCFSDGCDRSAPSLAVIDKSGGIHCNLAAFTGGLGASSSVAVPSRQGDLSGTYPSLRMFSCQRTGEAAFVLPLTFLLGTFFKFENQKF